LQAAYFADKEAIDAAIDRVMLSGWYVLGPEVAAFEQEFATWTGAGHCIGVGNGTDAIALALRAVGCGPGTSVVTVSHTVSATVAAVEQIGATPILVDIDPRTFTMDPTELADVLDRGAVPPIRAVLPVHLYGQPADMRAIKAACKRHAVALVDDCAHAFGAEFDGGAVGTLADVSAFSFYPTKNLGCFGDGGAVVTSDPEIADIVRALRTYGWKQRYVSEYRMGVDSRLDELQAAILRVRLKKLWMRQSRRRCIAAQYDHALCDMSVTEPHRDVRHMSANHLYVVRVAEHERDGFMEYLTECGIQSSLHYPVPVHLQPAYRDRVALGPARCVQSEKAAREVVTLPLYPEMTDEQVDIVCDALRGWE
jgi:dTDP-4-amino-4,6-dideoxygalactose transaminase